MEAYDPQKTARVWERVRGNEISELLPEWIRQEWLDAMTYLVLARRAQGRDSQLLRQLAQQEQDHVACLKGLYTLLTGNRPAVATPVLPKEDSMQLLRRSYGSHMHRLARYEAKSTDSDYGQIFTRLAQQEREQCQTILAILGRQKK